MKGIRTMIKNKKKNLADVIYKYGEITAYSGNGGIICPWDRDLLKHYVSREIVFMRVNPVDCHAYIQIK